MSENKQLIRGDVESGYKNIYPLSYTETVKDKKTGKSLEEILVGTNFLYLPYRNSKAATRLQVDERYRRKGLWIQYITNSGSLIVEYYNNEDVSNNKWIDDRYWVPYNSAQLNPGTIGLDAISQEAKDYLLTNSPVNTEDITRDSQSRLQLADRKYNPETPNGKGYKILRPNMLNRVNTLAQSMITEANTIYEIRYDFDLNGAEITMPEGSMFKFNGGSISVGGVKITDKYVFAKHIGMFPNLNISNVPTSNFRILRFFMNLGFVVIIDDCYYISTTGETLNNLNIIGINKGISKIICTNFGSDGAFVINSNIESITIQNITFDTTLEKGYLHFNRLISVLNKDKDILIKNIHINNCDVHGIRIFYFEGADKDMSGGKWGIKRFVIKDCYIQDIDTLIYCIDVPIEYMLVENIVIKQFYRAPIQVSTTNEYTNKSSAYFDTLIIRDCYIENTNINNDGVTYLCLVVAECLNIYYYNNVIKNIISTNDNCVCYDAYLTCNNLWYYNNKKTNIFSANIKYGDIFKCKDIVDGSKPSSRFIYNNTYKTDNTYLQNKGVSDSFVNSIGNFQSEMDYILFYNNSIVINYPNKLSLGNFISSKESVVSNNVILSDVGTDLKGSSLIVVQENTSRVVVENNKIQFNNKDSRDDSYSIIRNLSLNTDTERSIAVKNNIIKNIILFRRELNTLPIIKYIFSYNNIWEFSEEEQVTLTNNENDKIIVSNAFFRLYNNIKNVTFESLTNQTNYLIGNLPIPYSKYEFIISFNVLGVNVKAYLKVYTDEAQNTSYIICDGKNIMSGKLTSSIVRFNLYSGSKVQLMIYESRTPALYTAAGIVLENFNVKSYFDSDVDVNNVYLNQGTFDNKPNNSPIGFAYFCTDKQTSEGSTNGIMIYHKKDNVWVDALGRVIS